VRLRAARVDPSTLPEDLDVDWSRWSDGRAYRLKRKRDFPNVNPGLARERPVSRRRRAWARWREPFATGRLRRS
jgi:hypothetical protein